MPEKIEQKNYIAPEMINPDINILKKGLEQKRDVTKDEIIASSDFDVLKMEVSDKDISHFLTMKDEDLKKHYFEIINIRKIIKLILNDEDILRQMKRMENLDMNEEKLFINIIKQKVNWEIEDDALCDAIRKIRHSYHETLDLYTKNHYSNNINDALCDYADAYFQTKYALEVIDDAKKIIKYYFPDLFRSFQLKTAIYNTPDYANASHGMVENNIHKITISISEDLNGKRDYENLETVGVFGGNYKFKRKTCDLILAIHEYTHGIYSEIVTGGINHPVNYYLTIDSSFNEGLAVFMELIMVNKLLDDFDNLDLDKRNKEDLKEWKRQRVRSLYSKFDALRNGTFKEGDINPLSYLDGTLMIFNLYKKGGIENIEKFLKNINSEVTLKRIKKIEFYKARCEQMLDGLQKFDSFVIEQ